MHMYVGLSIAHLANQRTSLIYCCAHRIKRPLSNPSQPLDLVKVLVVPSQLLTRAWRVAKRCVLGLSIIHPKYCSHPAETIRRPDLGRHALSVAAIRLSCSYISLAFR